MLGFVKALREFERLIGRETVPLIHVALQAGEVVEQRRVGERIFLGDPRNDQRLVRDLLHNCLSFSLRAELSSGMFKLRVATRGVNFEKLLGFEVLHRQIAIHNHGENRGLHATETEQELATAVFHREEPGRIHAHDPIGLTPTTRRMVERLVIRRGLEFGEPLFDRIVRERTDPQALHRLGFTAGPTQNVAENQLTLATGIRRADDFLRGFEGRFDPRQLIVGGTIGSGP